MMPEIVTHNAAQALAELDEAQLNEMVRRVMGTPVTVTAWQAQLLGGLDSSPIPGGVYKLTGTAVTPTHNSLDWCLVIKILRSPEGLTLPDGTTLTKEMAETPNNFGYWPREALVAQSSLPDELPTDLRLPRFLGVTSVSEQECWLWQECLPENSTWTWDDYREAAFRLGQWQALPVQTALSCLARGLRQGPGPLRVLQLSAFAGTVLRHQA